jgi:hypothetical protein
LFSFENSIFEIFYFKKNQIKSADSGLTESWQYSTDSDSLTFKPIQQQQQDTKSSNTPTSSVTQTSKSRLKSVFRFTLTI